MTSRPSPKLLFLSFCSFFIFCLFLSPSYCLNLEDENQVRELINSGNRLLAARRYQEAIETYNKALNIDPGNRIAKGNIALVHNNWGTEFFNQRKYLEAKKQWETAVELDPNDNIARRNLRVLEVHIKNDRIRKEQIKARQEMLRKQKECLKQEKESALLNEKQQIESAKDTKQTVSKKEKKQKPQSAVLILNAGGTKYSSNSITSNQEDKPTIEKVELKAEDNFTNSKTGSIKPSNAEKESNRRETSNIKILNSNTADSTSVDTMVQNSLQTLKNSYQDKNNKNEDSTNNTETGTFKTVKEEPIEKNVSNESNAPEKVATEKEPEPDPPEKQRKRKKKKQKKQKNNSTLTIKEKIRKLEMAVFGEKRDSMPIVKRLEQLEKDTLGKKQSGPVNERVKRLNETYGL